MKKKIVIFSDKPRGKFKFLEKKFGVQTVWCNPGVEDLESKNERYIFLLDDKKKSPSSLFSRLEKFLESNIFILVCSEKQYRKLPENIKRQVYMYYNENYSQESMVGMINKGIRTHKLYRQIENLKELLQQKEQELLAFKISNQSLMDAFNLPTVLETLIGNIQNLLRSELWLLYICDDMNGPNRVEVLFGPNHEKETIERDTFLNKVAENIVKENQYYVINAFNRDLFPYIKEQCTITEINNMMGVQIKSKNRILGALIIINKMNSLEFSAREKNLVTALASHIAIILENSLLYKKSQQLSVIDDLTQIFNFRFLDETLDYEIKKSQKYRVPVTIFFLDLDGFKEVNERFGHIVGNSVLREIASLLQASIRETDVITRFGGDEFTIVLPETETEEAVHVARRIRQILVDHEFEGINPDFRIKASLGIATYPDHGGSKEDLIDAADLAMYQAKNSKEQISVVGE